MYGASNTGSSTANNFGIISHPWGTTYLATSTWKTNGGNIVLNGVTSGLNSYGIALDLQGFGSTTSTTVENTNATTGTLTLNGSATGATTQNLA